MVQGVARGARWCSRWRDAKFLGEEVRKYLSDLRWAGFEVDEVIEPMPPSDWPGNMTWMKDELRRPMMLLISAHKGGRY